MLAANASHVAHEFLSAARLVLGHNLLSQSVDCLLDRVLPAFSRLAQAECPRLGIIVSQLDREMRISVRQLLENPLTTHPVSPLSCASFRFRSSMSRSRRTAFVAASVVSMVDG